MKRPSWKRLEKKPEPKPEPKAPVPMKKAAPKSIPQPEEKPAPGIEVKLKKAAPGQTDKPKVDESKMPSLKHVEATAAEKQEEQRMDIHLKHVRKEVEEVRFCC